MTDVLTTVNTRQTSQSQQASPEQERNNAGGFSFTVSDLDRVRRFLTLGTDGGTYYVSAGDLTTNAAGSVFRMAKADHQALLDAIVSVSLGGLAPKQNPALFALAIAASVGDKEDRRRALALLPTVARTGTHLFLFARYVEQFRGWGRGLRKAVGSWYLDKDVDRLAYQVIKYRQREGWSHRDLLRLSHPVTADPAMRSLFDWVAHEAVGEDIPALVEGFMLASEPGANIPALIDEYGLSWEMLPSDALNEASTWDALLDSGIPQTALMRQLPRLTRLGLLPNIGGRTTEIAAQLADADRLVKARVHPVNVLIAQTTYASGHSVRGSSTWEPSSKIINALDEAFYAAFGAVEPAGKRTLLALDVSGSMGMYNIANTHLTARDASAALALVQMKTEPEVEVVGFTEGGMRSGGLTRLSLSPRQRLDDAIRYMSGLPFGGTDCALPMMWALKQNVEIDTFILYTDSETWCGNIHPHQALTRYRETTGIDAKMIVVGMTATEFTIADPNDVGSLDVVGFDSSVPNLINDFSRGI